MSKSVNESIYDRDFLKIIDQSNYKTYTDDLRALCEQEDICGESSLFKEKENNTVSIIRSVNNKEQLIEEINYAMPGDIIKIDKGDYADLNINIKDKNDLTIITDRNNEFKGINISTSENIFLKDGVINGQKEKNHIGINVDKSSDIALHQMQVTNNHDGIRVSNSENFILSNSKIEENRRDGFIGKSVNNLALVGNYFGKSHPNYELYNYPKQWGTGTNEADRETLPNGQRRDHADNIQLTNSEDLLALKNTINAQGGAFTQSIFIHNEEEKTQPEYYANSPTTLVANSIANGHPIGIKVCHQNDTYISNSNTLKQIPTNGISLDKEYAPHIIDQKECNTKE